MLRDDAAYAFSKTAVERYDFRIPGGFAWAKITVSSDVGLLQISSDYGDWSYRWGGDNGKPSFKAFLVGLNQEYLSDKLTRGKRDLLQEQTREAVQLEILRERRGAPRDVTRQQAREAWDAACRLDLDSEERALEELFQPEFDPIFHGEPWNFGVVKTCPCRSFARFYEELWAGAFVPELRKELEAAHG
jgi:hypothetical protein